MRLRKDFIDSREEGFTLLELMIVIGLVVLLTVMTIPYGMDFYRSRILEEETKSVSVVVERARTNALTGKRDKDWGVYFLEDDCYEIFSGDGERYEEGGRDDIYDQRFCAPSGVEVDTDIEEIIFRRDGGGYS